MSYIDDARNREITTFLSDIEAIIECDSFSQHALWKEFHERCEWKQNLSGYGVTVGYLAEQPVFISILKAVVDSVTILFINPTSEVVDWRMIEKWLKKNMPATAYRDSTYLNKQDAQNFSNALFDAKRRKHQEHEF